MEAHTGRHVDVEIGVMHPMQSPQQRHFVKKHVLQIDRKIERKEAEQGSDR